MGYRILVDENLDPQTVLFCRNRGHDAVHVEETLGKGTDDEVIAEYARNEDYVVVTNDRDFLDPERIEDSLCCSSRRKGYCRS